MQLKYDLIEDEEFGALSIVLSTPNILQHNTVKPKFEKYPAKLHARRVAKELGVDKGLIYVEGKVAELWDKSDMFVPFRQDRYFFYITGANFPGCSAAYDITNDHLTLFIPHIEPRYELYNGREVSPERCKELYDIDEVKYATEEMRRRPSWDISGLVNMLGDLGCAHSLINARTIYAKLQRQSNEGLSPDRRGDDLHFLQQSIALQQAIDRARVTKTPYEIEAIRRANDISTLAHTAVLERLLSLHNESQIEAIFQFTSQWHGAKNQAYPPIVGSGINAATLHYGANDEPLEGRQLVCLDAGAEWNCYASDVTRTLPISGKFSAEAQGVYDLVETMQEECIRRVRPGFLYHDLQLLAIRIATRGLLKIGILRGGSVDELMGHGVTAGFFPHGLGHHVGLEVHDTPSADLSLLPRFEEFGMQDVGRQRYPAGVSRPKTRYCLTPDMLASIMRDDARGTTKLSSNERKGLQPGMVVTIEPGIYFSRTYLKVFLKDDAKRSMFVDWDVLERYYDVGGVRIEDCVLVTEDGYDNLTKAPKGKAALKIINGRA